MFRKLFNIKINNNSRSNEQLFNDFQEWFDCDHQRNEQERLLQQELNYQHLIIRQQLKRILDEHNHTLMIFEMSSPSIMINLLILLRKVVPNTDNWKVKIYC
jgi:hypothetical protein